MGLSSSRFQLPALTALLLSFGCAPSMKQAGHTLTPNKEQRRDNSASPSHSKKDKPLSKSTDKELVVAPSTERKPLYAEVPEGGELIGETGPVALEDWGKGGHWVVHCSLPAGTKIGPRGNPDQPARLHLTVGATSEPVDALLSSDDSGRFLVVLSEGQPFLIDAVTSKRLDLSGLDPDLRFDEIPAHRSFAFTDAGLVILSGSEGKSGFFLPLSESPLFEADLSSWAHPIDFGARPVWRVEGHSRSFAGITVPEGSSEKSWPVYQSKSATLRCQSPAAPFFSFERVSAYRPDKSLSAVWSPVPTKSKKLTKLRPVEAPGFVFGFRDGWVRREESGRLLLVRGQTQEQIASERCGARILHADETTGFFLISCEEYAPVVPKRSAKTRAKPKYRFDLYLIRPGFVRSLKVDTMRTGIDYRGPAGQRFVPIRPGASAALVDFKKRVLVPLEGELQVLLSNASGAILRRGSELRLWTDKGEENIDVKLDGLDPILTKVHAAAVGQTMLVLDGTLRSWKLPAAPLAITEQGYAIVPKKAPTLGNWPEGPLLLLGPPREESPRAPSDSR